MNREPDLSIVLSAVRELSKRLRTGHLVSLESTTYPGTTREEVLPILAQSGLEVGKDFFLAFSPERIDPGREDWTVKSTPKVVGGVTPACTDKAVALYQRAMDTVFSVSSPEAAELTKLLENIFRSVNIALVNELAQLCDRMHVDVWEVVEAAATKPFGFMSFKPGPGLGGHCLPVDPFYLAWKAREFDFYTEFIELAGKVNENMPYFCLEKVTRALNSQEKAVKGSRVHIVGVAYKADVGDLRESPALKLIELLRDEGAGVSYHDPHVPELPDHGLTSADLDGSVASGGLRRDRDRPFRDRLWRARGEGAARGRLPQRDRQGRLHERTRVEAMRLAAVGLGYWGPNLARNLDELQGAELAWICDREEERLERFGARFPDARKTTSFEEVLADVGVDAVAIATPVVTHFELARQALLAGKHVFVEKPLALSSALGEQLVALAEERALVLMPGHLLLYHPGVAKLKDLVDSEELGRLLYVYGNRQNLGQFRKDENALWSLGAHDLSVILHLVGEEPVEAWARGESFLNPGVEDVVFCYLRFPSGVVAHMHLSWLDPHKMRRMTVVGDKQMAVFDDMEPERKVTVYDKGPEQRPDAREWQTRTGDISIPKVANDEPLRLECEHFLALLRGEGDRSAAAREGLAVVRALEQLQSSLEREYV